VTGTGEGLVILCTMRAALMLHIEQ